MNKKIQFNLIYIEENFDLMSLRVKVAAKQDGFANYLKIKPLDETEHTTNFF